MGIGAEGAESGRQVKRGGGGARVGGCRGAWVVRCRREGIHQPGVWSVEWAPGRHAGGVIQ